MAEIQPSSNTAANKRSPGNHIRVDLTPMVDLGFLLITFFVFTTTMARPTAMNLVMPNDEQGAKDLVCASCVLTLLLAENNTIMFYEGLPEDNPIVQVTVFGDQGIRDLILRKKAQIRNLKDTSRQLVLIIKSSKESTFQNFVDIVDEVAINDVRHYYLSDINDSDKRIFNLRQ